MPKVSVIIPVYNTEKYLRECLDSVVNQTLEDIEIICINDGSTDSSLEILKEYAKNDKRIIILEQRNKGSGIARNYGLKIACGEYIAFMDGDDMYPEKNTLEIVYNAAIQNNVMIAGGEFSSFRQGDTSLSQNFCKDTLGYLFDKDGIVNYRDYQFDYGYHRFLYNRKFLNKNKLFFPDYRRYQDPPFFARAMLKAGEFFAIDKITYAYRGGHKKINWDIRKINDLLSGIQDNMKLAYENDLPLLNEYSFIRLKQHYKHIYDSLDNKAINKILKMVKYNPLVNQFIMENHIMLLFWKKIFSVKNKRSHNKVHKVITICGLKLKFRNKKKEREIAAKEQRDTLYCIKAQNDSILKYLEQGINFETSSEKEKEICKK